MHDPPEHDKASGRKPSPLDFEAACAAAPAAVAWLYEQTRQLCRDLRFDGERLWMLALRQSDREARRRAWQPLWQATSELDEAMCDSDPLIALRHRLALVAATVGELDIAHGELDELLAALIGPADRAVVLANRAMVEVEAANFDAAVASFLGAADADADAAPFPVDQYHAERVLGAGGFAVVFLCRQKSDNRRVVIKAVDPLRVDRSFPDVFHEVTILEQIDSHEVVRLLGYGHVNRERLLGPYIVLEYFEGLSLHHYVSRYGVLSWQNLAPIALAVLRGLAAVHARHIVHRDLTPANVLVRCDADGWRVKIIDFGIATRTVFAAGTPGFAAPEQLGKRLHAVSPSADVYAFGRTCCYALCARPDLDRREHVPSRLAALIDECLSETPERRPTVERLADEFAAWVQRGQINEPTPGTMATPGSAAPSSRMITPPTSTAAPKSAENAWARAREIKTWVPGESPVRVAPPPSATMETPPHMVPPRTPMSAAVRDAADPTGEARPRYLDENVQFTVFRPRAVLPMRWYAILTFAHLSERPIDAEPDEPDPVAEVQRQARQVLGEQAREFQSLTQDSQQAVPREAELAFVPEIEGFEINPPRRSFRWSEPVHREEFRVRAPAGLIGRTVRGRLTVFLGSLVLADVPLTIRVTAEQVLEPERAELAPVGARPYRKIFASYSHRDLAIVEQVERFAAMLGDQYLRDWTHLRAGQVWNDRLLEMIREADVFQLFWSSNSMRSSYVRREWEYALSLGRDHFIRPTYWEVPFPSVAQEDLPPARLKRLHFQRIEAPAPPAADAADGRAAQPSAAAPESAGPRSPMPPRSPPPSRSPAAWPSPAPSFPSTPPFPPTPCEAPGESARAPAPMPTQATCDASVRHVPSASPYAPPAAARSSTRFALIAALGIAACIAAGAVAWFLLN